MLLIETKFRFFILQLKNIFFKMLYVRKTEEMNSYIIKDTWILILNQKFKKEKFGKRKSHKYTQLKLEYFLILQKNGFK